MGRGPLKRLAQEVTTRAKRLARLRTSRWATVGNARFDDRQDERPRPGESARAAASLPNGGGARPAATRPSHAMARGASDRLARRTPSWVARPVGAARIDGGLVVRAIFRCRSGVGNRAATATPTPRSDDPGGAPGPPG